MSDLISRKALLEDMKHFCRGNCRNCDYSTFLASDEHCGLIDRQPIAYDLKAVVEQLEETFDKWGLDKGKKDIMIEIVESGGAENDG